MHKIKRRTVATPKGAMFAKGVRSGDTSSVTVSYFTEGKVPIHNSRINPAARFMYDHEFLGLIEMVEKPKAAPSSPKNEIDRGDNPDLDYGRDLLDKEKKAVDDTEEYDNGDDEIHHKKQKVGYSGKKADLKGKGPGTPVGKSQATDPGKSLSESHANATYSWKSILRALSETQMTTDEIRAIAMSLSGSEITEDIEDDKVAQDTETALSTNDPARQTQAQEIFTGQPMRNVFNAIESVPAGDVESIANLAKGTKINIIRHGQSVSKILPSSVINTINQDGKVVAEVSVADKTIKLTVARAGNVFLKRGRETGKFYYLSPIEA